MWGSTSCLVNAVDVNGWKRRPNSSHRSTSVPSYSRRLADISMVKTWHDRRDVTTHGQPLVPYSPPQIGPEHVLVTLTPMTERRTFSKAKAINPYRKASQTTKVLMYGISNKRNSCRPIHRVLQNYPSQTMYTCKLEENYCLIGRGDSLTHYCDAQDQQQHQHQQQHAATWTWTYWLAWEAAYARCSVTSAWLLTISIVLSSRRTWNVFAVLCLSYVTRFLNFALSTLSLPIRHLTNVVYLARLSRKRDK